ncbi:MAG: 2-oxo acid dehydrogenase subunit E2, partial [Anaerolineales bacterium]
KGEPVVVIETDKITSEVEAPATGRLARILYHENQTAPVTKVVAYILEEGETEADLPKEEKPEVEKPSEVKEDLPIKSESKKSATPVAKRMADVEDIDLANVKAAGEKITKEDIQAYIKEHEKIKTRVETPATPAARRIAEEERVDLKKVPGSGPRGRVQAADVTSFVTQKGKKAKLPDEKVALGETLELSSMRKRIAERLTNSYQTTPHIFLTVEVDMSQSEESRKRLNELAAKQGLPKISLTAYLVRVAAWCLKRHPYLNASLLEDQINFWEEINIGVATALEEGLIVPVIHQADQMTTSEINEHLLNLTQRARSGELTREEIQGGTFTISNLGMFGIHSFTAIINPPQSAILAVGTTTRRPIFIDKEDTIDVRPMMMLTLSADHRIVDGAVAAKFLADLVNVLETPEMLIF